MCLMQVRKLFFTFAVIYSLIMNSWCVSFLWQKDKTGCLPDAVHVNTGLESAFSPCREISKEVDWPDTVRA